MSPLINGLLIISLCLSLVCECACYREGDLIPASGRGQFGKSVTDWRDILGEACPIFGIDSLSQVELPGPPSAGGGGYRLALALSRDGKVRTPWLSVLGARAPPVPYIDVLLHADSVDLLRAEARVESMLADDTALYEELVTHWLNGTAWPKSILVKWHWADDARGASHRALTIALTVCVGLATLALLRAVLPASRDLANLTADLVEGFQHKAD